MKGLFLFLAIGICAFAQSPVINPQNGIVNTASYQADQGVSPGGLVTIFGSDLASSLAQSDTIPLSAAIGNVSVTINDIKAPLVMVSPNQINAQVPWELLKDAGSTGTANVVVTQGSGVSEARAVQVNPFSPGIFTLPFGFGQAVAVNADGTLAAPSGAFPGTSSAPAKAGGIVTIYATGLGPVDPPLANGANSVDTQRVTTTVPVVTVGDKAATIQFSGLSPLYPGVYQINFTLASDTPTGTAVPLVISMADVKSTQKATIAVQ